MKPLPTGPISFEEFLDWCDEDTRAEWVNGKVVLMSPNSLPHQEVVMFLTQVLGIYVKERRLGQIVIAPFLMHFPDSAREPDLIFITTALAPKLHRTFLDGPADLVVEVISPESMERDREEKFAEYARHGVREYWLLDADQRTAEFFQLLPGRRRFDLLPVGSDGMFRSKVVDGFCLRPEWLWPPSATVKALRELGLLSDGSGGGR